MCWWVFCYRLLCFASGLSLSSALCCLGSPQGFTFHLLLIKLTLDYSRKEKKSWWRNDSEGRVQNARAMHLSNYFLFTQGVNTLFYIFDLRRWELEIIWVSLIIEKTKIRWYLKYSVHNLFVVVVVLKARKMLLKGVRFAVRQESVSSINS